MTTMSTKRRTTASLRHDYYPQMVEVVPPSVRGAVRIEHFEVSEFDAQMANLRSSFHPGGRTDEIEAGRYARLYVNNCLVMSDTDMECRTNRDAVVDATGDVLIGGLGLGLIVLPMLKKSDVRKVTVVEKNIDVIELVAPALRKYAGPTASSKLFIDQGDVDTWRPFNSKVTPHSARQFDYIYFDIWPTICPDDYAHHVKLHRRYQAYLRKGGKVTSWRHEWLHYLKRRDTGW